LFYSRKLIKYFLPIIFTIYILYVIRFCSIEFKKFLLISAIRRVLEKSLVCRLFKKISSKRSNSRRDAAKGEDGDEISVAGCESFVWHYGARGLPFSLSQRHASLSQSIERLVLMRIPITGLHPSLCSHRRHNPRFPYYFTLVCIAMEILGRADIWTAAIADAF